IRVASVLQAWLMRPNEKSAELFGFLLANAGKFGLVICLPFQAGWGGYRAWPPPYPPLSLRAIPNCWTRSEKSFGENITAFGPSKPTSTGFGDSSSFTNT